MSSLWDYICTSGRVARGGGGGRRGRSDRDQAETIKLFERGWPLLPATGGVGSDTIRVLLELHPGMPVVSPLAEEMGARAINDSMRKVRDGDIVHVCGFELAGTDRVAPAAVGRFLYNHVRSNIRSIYIIHLVKLFNTPCRR